MLGALDYILFLRSVSTRQWKRKISPRIQLNVESQMLLGVYLSTQGYKIVSLPTAINRLKMKVIETCQA